MFNTFLHTLSTSKKLLLAFVLIIMTHFGYSQRDSITVDTLSKTYTGETVDSIDSTVATATYQQDTEEIKTNNFDTITVADMPSYQAYYLHDSIIKNLKKDKDFWYVDKTPPRQKPEETNSKDSKKPFYVEDWFRVLVWIIILGGFIAVLVWFLISSDIHLFRKKPKLIESVTGEDYGEDIFSVNYEDELEKTKANENYRLAVRLMYLHLLRLFSEKNIIDYKIERTNSDYLLQLYNTSYYKNFFRLTRNFEYVWYGKFDISNDAFEIIGRDYTNLKMQLP